VSTATTSTIWLWAIPCMPSASWRQSGGHEGLSIGAQRSGPLSEWKRDPTNLRERFDADRDGEVNLAEWAKAREAAQREVDRRHLETGQPAALHLLRAPADGRPYLV
jgi:hypothetical protein